MFVWLSQEERKLSILIVIPGNNVVFHDKWGEDQLDIITRQVLTSAFLNWITQLPKLTMIKWINQKYISYISWTFREKGHQTGWSKVLCFIRILSKIRIMETVYQLFVFGNRDLLLLEVGKQNKVAPQSPWYFILPEIGAIVFQSRFRVS